MQMAMQGYERFANQALVEDIVFFVALVGFLIWAIYLVNAGLRRRQQMQMQQQLMDKFSSAHDFAEFMQSPAGQKYVMSFSDIAPSPRNSILSSVRLGIVLLFAGPAFCVIPFDVPALRAAAWGTGIVITMLGVGFLISAMVSHLIARRIKSE